MNDYSKSVSNLRDDRSSNTFQKASPSNVFKNHSVDFLSDDKSLCNSQSASSFLRIYFDTSTSVVEKKRISLREAVQAKLKSRNLDVDSCVPYFKETNMKVDWNIKINQIDENSIVISTSKEEVSHCFVKKLALKDKKLFSIKNCDSCKRRFYFNVYSYSCKKCDYTLCQNEECKLISDSLVCILKKPKSIKINNTSIFSKPKINFNNSQPATLKRKWLMLENISEQILPVTEITFAPRVRSFSDPEIVSIGSTQSSSKNNTEKMLRTDKNGSRSARKNTRKWDSFISWEIPFNRIKIDNKIGAGSFGIVHQGNDFYHGIVAVKFLNVKNPTQQQINSFRNEIAILKSTRHDNILLFVGCILKPNLAIVTEWCPGSSLYRHIHIEDENWEMYQLIDIAKQTSVGMEYLHARGILHRDLKSNNIFLIPKEPGQNMSNQFSINHYQLDKKINDGEENLKWTVKIGDFGLATVKTEWMKDKIAKKTQPTGSILWMAPEVITQRVENPYTQKSDVYSFAVVLYELVTGHLPFMHKEQNMILFLVGSGRLKLNPYDDARTDTPEIINDLIVRCSSFDRDNRPDFVEINEIFKEINFYKPKKVTLKRSVSAPHLTMYSESYWNPEKDIDYVTNDDDIFSDINLIKESSSPTFVSSPFKFDHD